MPVIWARLLGFSLFFDELERELELDFFGDLFLAREGAIARERARISMLRSSVIFALLLA